MLKLKLTQSQGPQLLEISQQQEKVRRELQADLAHLPESHHGQLAKQIVRHGKEAYELSSKAPRLVSRLRLGRFTVLPNVLRPEVMSSRFLAQFLFDHPEFYRDKTVMDMGCGSGLLGALMAKQASKVYFCDIMPAALDNAQLNIRTLGLSHNCEVAPPGDLFETLPSNAKPELIVFNHPFFSGEAVDKYPVSQTMLAPPSLIERFLDTAARTYRCPVIMPFYSLAASELRPDQTNNPAYWGPKYGYTVASERSANLMRLQPGEHRIYRLTP